MRRNSIKAYLVVGAILFPIISCTPKEDKEIKNNQVNQSINVDTINISQGEYNKWVVQSYEGNYDPDGKPYTLPDIGEFDYPYVHGMENKELQNKLNVTIKNAIFSEEFFSKPMAGVSITITPWSEFEFPGIIINKNILSIPITLYWCREKNYYKSMSVTIDMTTGERLFLEDILNIDKSFAEKILYKENFFIDIDTYDGTRDYLHNFYDSDINPKSEVIENLLETLRNNMPKRIKAQIDCYYLTTEGIVLTHFANDGVPWEINIPLENLKDYLKVKSWK